MRVATFNMKQGVAPKKKPHELWEWIEREIDPDIIVLTEAKVPDTGVPMGWSALWDVDGIDPRRRWGTVLAGRGVGLDPIEVQAPWNAIVQVADVVANGRRWATVVGMYGLTVDQEGKSCGHGGFSVPLLLDAIEPLLQSDRGERLIVAGDMNLWPCHVAKMFEDRRLGDLIEFTANERPPLERCANCSGRAEKCGHLWTHKNGSSPSAAVQQLDFIFATESMAAEIDVVYGGVGDFPDSWNVSDHAPVVAEFRNP
jgi:exonuclease III